MPNDLKEETKKIIEFTLVGFHKVVTKLESIEGPDYEYSIEDMLDYSDLVYYHENYITTSNYWWREDLKEYY